MLILEQSKKSVFLCIVCHYKHHIWLYVVNVHNLRGWKLNSWNIYKGVFIAKFSVFIYLIIITKDVLLKITGVPRKYHFWGSKETASMQKSYSFQTHWRCNCLVKVRAHHWAPFPAVAIWWDDPFLHLPSAGSVTSWSRNRFSWLRFTTRLYMTLNS